AKGVAKDPSVVPAMTALKMATINGAKALGIEDTTGSLSIGKAADVIAINLDQLETQPLFDPVSQIVYAVNRQQVTDVWVAGKQLLKNRNLTTINIDDLKQKVLAWQEKLKT
ncbi:MAG: amidohydrolase family protein, partial [Methylococcales bacterium]|nr:amidohydrolase family protein [Methylococcales bacterium]